LGESITIPIIIAYTLVPFGTRLGQKMVHPVLTFFAPVANLRLALVGGQITPGAHRVVSDGVTTSEARTFNGSRRQKGLCHLRVGYPGPPKLVGFEDPSNFLLLGWIVLGYYRAQRIKL